MIHINKAKMYLINEQLVLNLKSLSVWGPVTVMADHPGRLAGRGGGGEALRQGKRLVLSKRMKPLKNGIIDKTRGWTINSINLTACSYMSASAPARTGPWVMMHSYRGWCNHRRDFQKWTVLHRRAENRPGLPHLGARVQSGFLWKKYR